MRDRLAFSAWGRQNGVRSISAYRIRALRSLIRSMTGSPPIPWSHFMTSPSM